MDLDVPEDAPKRELRRPYQLINQKVDLEVDFGQRINGSTQLTIFPDNPDVRTIRLHARQCNIESITINGLKATCKDYQDPCDALSLHTIGSVNQHHILKAKIEDSLELPPLEDLIITLPEQLKIEFNPEFVTQQAGIVKAAKLDGTNVNDAQAADGLADTQISKFTRLDVLIKFSSIHTRDALHFATGSTGSGRWPHVYTRGGFHPGRASCLFPCIDDVRIRCPWEFSIKGPRTVGDALRQISPQDHTQNLDSAYEIKEMTFVCPGEFIEDTLDATDSSQRTVSFAISQNVAAEQIGFAIGPFDKVDLNIFRDAEEAELLQDRAVNMTAYCLPGRKEDVENTCLPTTMGMDFFVKNYIPFPFPSFSFVFVEDHGERPQAFTGLAMCSTRLLYPEDVLDGTKEITRKLINSMASQWLGVQILPEKPEDTWAVVGMSLYITEQYMKELCGNNEYRYYMKHQSDRIAQLDFHRPSIYDMGALLHVDEAEYDFLAMKAPVVLYILDRRMAKTTGASKMTSAIAKIMGRARNDDLKDNLLSTETLMERVEKLWYNTRTDDFVNQWIKGAGCPSFRATQRFNKKKLVIEMTIKQIQGTTTQESELSPETFMRDVREDAYTVYESPLQSVFTGPMTIRIHEADGTPYEHIVEIKEAVTQVEVPYNTKYKRLKRSKRQRAKAATKAAEAGDDENDALVYCLGDTLQTEDDIAKWRLTEWSPEDEERMNSESYEWIRLDADFEWICNMWLNMPGYMYASQLQQDRDVAAQLVSIQHIQTYTAQPLVSTILIRTMMDDRYFHAIRTGAAHALVKHATTDNGCNMIGLYHLKRAFEEIYCAIEGDSVITRPNDFSNQLSYYFQSSLIEAISRVRDEKGHTPQEVKEFLIDKLRFNDNSLNDFSDAHYVATIMRSLTNAMIARPNKPAPIDGEDVEMDMAAEEEFHDMQQLEAQCLAEIDRYRRMDEWTSSHQNLYSRTALECQAKLARNGIGTFSPLHYLQYTRPGNYDMLRGAAYTILSTTNLFSTSSTPVLKYLLHSLAADSSPYIRAILRTAFGEALARKAIGETKPDAPRAAGLVIEDVNLDERKAELARRSSLDAALEALRTELTSNPTLSTSLWSALTHPDIGFEDMRYLLEYCAMLYTPEDKAIVVLRKPRFWRLHSLGNGKLRFEETRRLRDKPLIKWKSSGKFAHPTPAATALAAANQAKPKKLNITFKKRDSLAPTTPLTTTSASPPPLPPPMRQTESPAPVAAKAISLKLGPSKPLDPRPPPSTKAPTSQPQPPARAPSVSVSTPVADKPRKPSQIVNLKIGKKNSLSLSASASSKSSSPAPAGLGRQDSAESAKKGGGMPGSHEAESASGQGQPRQVLKLKLKAPIAKSG